MGVIFMKSLVYVPFLLELYTICLAVSKMQSASAVILSEQKAFGVLWVELISGGLAPAVCKKARDQCPVIFGGAKKESFPEGKDSKKFNFLIKLLR